MRRCLKNRGSCEIAHGGVQFLTMPAPGASRPRKQVSLRKLVGLSVGIAICIFLGYQLAMNFSFLRDEDSSPAYDDDFASSNNNDALAAAMVTIADMHPPPSLVLGTDDIGNSTVLPLIFTLEILSHPLTSLPSSPLQIGCVCCFYVCVHHRNQAHRDCGGKSLPSII